jgi:hypothetical protein
MLSEKSLRETKHKSVVRLSPKIAPAAIRAAILLYAIAIPRLGAETNTNPCQEPELKPNQNVSFHRQRMPNPSNNTEYVNVALASERLNEDNQDGTAHAHNALLYLTCSSQDPEISDICNSPTMRGAQPPGVFLRVLQELDKGVNQPRTNSVCKRDKSVYQWALGQPDDRGPTTAGMPNFIDTLAKANTLGIKQKSKHEQDLAKAKLFACTQKIIEDIYESDQGPLNISKIDRYYRGDTYARYAGLILLLEDVRGADDQCDAECEEHMEKLRAALELDADRLGGQIAAKVSAPPKQ